jgi:hypothetical protein
MNHNITNVSIYGNYNRIMYNFMYKIVAKLATKVNMYETRLSKQVNQI